MIAALTLFIITIDQASKLMVSRIQALLPIEIIEGVFSINLVRNSGAAFGMLPGQLLFFVIVSVIAIILILTAALRYRFNLLLKISLSLILGGGIGNLIDRIRFGYVIDFLDFKIWPVFNIADSAVTVGTILLLLQLVLKSNIKYQKSK